MKIRHPSKNSFAICQLTEVELIQIHNESTNKQLKAEIQEVLYDAIEDENINNNLQINPGLYWHNRGLIIK